MTRRLAALIVLPLALAACWGNSEDAVFQGYVEGDFVEVAPEVGGRIVELAVRRGSAVEAGAVLFRLDDSEAKASVAQAEAELQRAKAQLANLRQGQRPPEIAVIDAQIAEAQAALDNARRNFERQQALFERRVTSEAQLDQAREAISVAEARVTAAERQKDVAAMPARTPEIEAGERAVEAAEAALAQARTRLAKHVVSAPAAGRVEDVFYEAGEVAAAGAPVLSLLPDGRRKVIFFVREAARPGIATGAEVSIACDGCPDGIKAEVTFLGSEAEFTPPVIFSRDTREKLVFRAEAHLPESAPLPLGQPVDVTVAARASP
jgi:HlyD family secretion protein